MPDVDPNGVAHINETDPRSPFSSLMRLITDPLSVIVDGIKDRLDALEAVAGGDSGWVTAGVFTARAGWSVTGYNVRRIGRLVHVGFLNVQRTGADLTVPADGNLGNFPIVDVAAGWRSSASSGALQSSATGRMIAATLRGSGTYLEVAATTPGSNITTGTTVSFTGFWFLD